jgi:hypothetical protein
MLSKVVPFLKKSNQDSSLAGLKRYFIFTLQILIKNNYYLVFLGAIWDLADELVAQSCTVWRYVGSATSEYRMYFYLLRSRDSLPILLARG